MAYRRRRTNGGGRRRFFRRRGIRQTTEQGGSLRGYERCFFTYLTDTAISIPSTVYVTSTQLVMGDAFINAAAGVGTEAAAVARMLSLPMKGFDVLAVQADVHLVFAPGVMNFDQFATGAGNDLANAVALVGCALYSNRMGADGTEAVPQFLESQWPVNQGTPSTAQEDMDFGLRTHYKKTSLVWPHFHQIINPASDAEGLAFGRPTASFSIRTKLRRRFTDTQCLSLATFIRTPFGDVGFNAITAYVSGSLWYRMRL